MKYCHTSNMDLTSRYFRATSTSRQRSFLAVRASPVECFHQSKDHFSGNGSFLSFLTSNKNTYYLLPLPER